MRTKLLKILIKLIILFKLGMKRAILKIKNNLLAHLKSLKWGLGNLKIIRLYLEIGKKKFYLFNRN